MLKKRRPTMQGKSEEQFQKDIVSRLSPNCWPTVGRQFSLRFQCLNDKDKEKHGDYALFGIRRPAFHNLGQSQLKI